MMFLFWGSMISVIIFVINMVSILKKIRDNKETENNTIALCFSLMFILIAIFNICD